MRTSVHISGFIHTFTHFLPLWRCALFLLVLDKMNLMTVGLVVYHAPDMSTLMCNVACWFDIIMLMKHRFPWVSRLGFQDSVNKVAISHEVR